MTAHNWNDDAVEVRTWVHASVRESVGAALRDLVPHVPVQHVIRRDQLYEAFPYRSRAILVCSVPHPGSESDGETRRSFPLIDLISDWDGALLLYGRADAEFAGGGA